MWFGWEKISISADKWVWFWSEVNEIDKYRIPNESPTRQN
jgi:hypothetical protein